MTSVNSIVAVCLLALLTSCSQSIVDTSTLVISDKLSITHGVSTGDVTSTTAVIWARANTTAKMVVKIDGISSSYTANFHPDNDFTAKVFISDLMPDTKYHFSVWAQRADRRSNTVAGYFHTAPPRDQHAAVTFSFSGDLAGQNVCRHKQEGFPIFNIINTKQPDFFIGLGDMIYADGLCKAIGKYGNEQIVGHFEKSHDLTNYWAHWKYAREDEGFRQLMTTTPYYFTWDDHEVVNDFGPFNDTRDTAPYQAGLSLLPMGLQAMLDYNPIATRALTPGRLYRHFSWGAHADFFILDLRQYRDSNHANDSPAHPKTLLGREQYHWLMASLKNSTATWKFIVSSVPIAIPTGHPTESSRDGWASLSSGVDQQTQTGFEYELTNLLSALQQMQANVIFLSADVHFASVFSYQPVVNSDFTFYEFIAGPINAGIFPRKDLDHTFNPTRHFFLGPEDGKKISSWQEAKRWMNFATVHIKRDGTLSIQYHNALGEKVYSKAGISPVY